MSTPRSERLERTEARVGDVVDDDFFTPLSFRLCAATFRTCAGDLRPIAVSSLPLEARREARVVEPEGRLDEGSIDLAELKLSLVAVVGVRESVGERVDEGEELVFSFLGDAKKFGFGMTSRPDSWPQCL